MDDKGQGVFDEVTGSGLWNNGGQGDVPFAPASLYKNFWPAPTKVAGTE
jgi:hypothetical protein